MKPLRFGLCGPGFRRRAPLRRFGAGGFDDGSVAERDTGADESVGADEAAPADRDGRAGQVERAGCNHANRRRGGRAAR